MSTSGYLRRIITELTGKPPKHSHVAMPYGLILAVLFSVFLVGFIFWSIFSSKPQRQATDCVFRITEKGTPPPVTAGDSMQLNTCVQLERVASYSSRMLGLSNRPSLPWDRGMLFDFEKPGRHCMWMKHMHFSLDMLWLNEQKEIVARQKNVSPDTYPQSFCGPSTARYVVEVNAGVIEAGDLRLGQHLNL